MSNKLINFTAKGTGVLAGHVPPALLAYPFARLISRTRHDAGLFRYEKRAESVAELTKQKPHKKNWAECSRLRARALLDLGRARYYLSFSGGIDSTAMVVSFLSEATAEERGKLVIYLSAHSIQENPTFFESHVLGLPLLSSMQDISDRLLREDAMLVNGECGDQLFGSDMLGEGAAAFGDDILHRPYRDAALKIFGLTAREPEHATQLLDHFEPIVPECPIPVKTAHDFFWWLNFSQKWQHVKYRYPTHQTWNLAATYGEHVVAFYDSLDFQLWSLANHDRKLRESWLSYKFTVKDYIHRYTRDPAQLGLRKQISLEKTYLVSECRLAVNDRHEEVKSAEELITYVRTN